MTKRRKPLLGVALLTLPVLWFACFDKSWFVGECKHCGSGQDIVQFRIVGIPLYEYAYDYETEIQKISIALGNPCLHRSYRTWHRHRYWGMLYCAAPCHNGIDRAIGKNWATGKFLEQVKASAVLDPELPQQFKQRVLIEQDWKYLKAFKESIEGSLTQN